ncbi:MAG TPA: MFS transporter [Thermomicrobiales bacterium]|nr:MFS transporter [Thermomicrobiales bacterium]
MQTASITPADVPALQARVVRILMLSQVFGGVGLGAGIAVGALLAEDLFSTTSLAGLPSALFALGAAGGSMAVGRISDRSGRRVGLGVGYATAALGAFIVVLSAVLTNPVLFVTGMVLYGVGTATNLQARYAGADLADSTNRGRSVSRVLVATTLGAVLGPNLIDAMGAVGEAVGVPSLAGPFLLAGTAFAAAGVVLQILLRPDPLVAAKALALKPATGTTARPVSTSRPSWSMRQGTLAFGALTMVITQIVMTGIMTMTPIHMRDHGHGLGETGLVISIHIACMYLPSPISGWLADRFGAPRTAMLSGTVLVLAGITAASVPADGLVGLIVALALLGFGWNLGLIAGTTIVTEATPVTERARTQGTVDLLIGLAGSAGGISSGIMVNEAGYSTLALTGAVIAVVLVPIMFGSIRVRQSTMAGASGD